MNRFRGAVWRWATIPVLLLLAGCAEGGTAGGGRADGPEGTGDAEAACAAVVRYDGHDYWGHGDLARTPELTGRTGTGIRPACDDGNGAAPREEVEVEELAALPLKRGFLVGGQAYVREGKPFPESIRAWFEPPRCEGEGAMELSGRWVGVTSPHEPRFDGDLRAPYRLTVWVDAGAEDYVGSRVVIRAGEGTDPQLGPEDVRRALWREGTLDARVHCEDGRFVADGLTTRAD